MNTVAISERNPGLKAGLLVIAIVIVVILGYRQVVRASTISVWTAAETLRAGTVLSPARLTQVRMRKKALPLGVLTDQQQIAGRTLGAPKPSGRPFLETDFALPTRAPTTPLTAHIPEGRVLTTLSIEPTAIPYPQLRYGDRLGVVAVQGLGTEHGSVVARDAFMIGSLAPKPTKTEEPEKGPLGMDLSPPRREAKRGPKGLALLLALHPRDVLRLAEAEAANAQFKIILHGKHEVDRGTLLNLAAPGPRVVELLAGAVREEVSIQP